MRRRTFGAGLTGVAAAVVSASAVMAAATSVRVDEDGDAGWIFNRDASTSTPYHFSLDAASTGAGSLFVPPIDNLAGDGGPDPRDKFIAEQFLNTPADFVTSIGYDFLVASTGLTDYKHFYLNVYVQLPGGAQHFYDCRFDFVPPGFDPVAPSGFSTFTVDGSTSPTHVGVGGDGGRLGCPATLDGLPAGANIDFFSLSVGDTSVSLSDAEVSGYYDNVVVSYEDGSSTAFDFEVLPTVKDACKDGGWADFGVFSNQGDCVSFLQADHDAPD